MSRDSTPFGGSDSLGASQAKGSESPDTARKILYGEMEVMLTFHASSGGAVSARREGLAFACPPISRPTPVGISGYCIHPSPGDGGSNPALII
jgi:hypothetical protein